MSKNSDDYFQRFLPWFDTLQLHKTHHHGSVIKKKVLWMPVSCPTKCTDPQHYNFLWQTAVLFTFHYQLWFDFKTNESCLQSTIRRYRMDRIWTDGHDHSTITHTHTLPPSSHTCHPQPNFVTGGWEVGYKWWWPLPLPIFSPSNKPNSTWFCGSKLCCNYTDSKNRFLPMYL